MMRPYEERYEHRVDHNLEGKEGTEKFDAINWDNLGLVLSRNNGPKYMVDTVEDYIRFTVEERYKPIYRELNKPYSTDFDIRSAFESEFEEVDYLYVQKMLTRHPHEIAPREDKGEVLFNTDSFLACAKEDAINSRDIEQVKEEIYITYFNGE